MDNNTQKQQKQQLLIEYLISSPDTFALCKSIVESSYFDPEFRKTVEFIHTYYDKYNSVPSTEQIYAETYLPLKTHAVTRDQIQYCADQVEQFCRRKAIESAILSAPAMISEGNYGAVEQLIRDAITVSLNKDLGTDYFKDRANRLDGQLKTPLRTSSGWRDFDEQTAGGLARKEMVLFSANSGGGKSITLANLAVNFLAQKLNVLYITLELAENLVAQRFDSLFTNIPSVVWQQRRNDIVSTLDNLTPHVGNLTIKHMPTGTNANAIRAYIKEFELKNGFVPDLLIVDYLDLMGANEKVSADNIWEKDKRATEQLRDILFEYNMYGATASQQNRSAIDATELNQGHIAGGISKVNTVDVYASIILTATMKAAGELGMVFLKTRNSDGVGKTIYMKWDNATLRITNLPRDKDDGNDAIAARVSSLKGPANPKRSLSDLLDM